METEYRKVIEKYKKIIQEQKKATIILAIAVFTIIFLFILVYVPPWRVAHFGINDSVKVAELENSYRATIAQIIGGIAIIIGLYYTWQRITIAENNLKVAQEGQITERFTRAVDQLGNKKIEVRVGGVYALERISNESEKDYWSIMEILTTYVRINSNVDPDSNSSTFNHVSKEIQASESIEGSLANVRRVPPDIQTILTVLGRRKHRYKNIEPKGLCLYGVCLNMIGLPDEVHFEGADFGYSHLKGAYLITAHLEEAVFSNAHLEKAFLLGAHLEKAIFPNAHIEEAVLTWAHLEGALLDSAHLEGAYFQCTHLEGASFKSAHLEEVNFMGAHLEGAQNLTIDQLSKVKTLYNAKLDEELLIPLKERYPLLFEKPDDPF